MAAALAANYLHIKVGHVEAGLRTFNKASPFPEELNRRINASLSDIHFPPTIANKNNLLTEGIPADRIFVSGNTVVDALLLANEKIQKNNDLKGKIEKYFEERLNFDFMQKQFLIVTTHRRENFGAGLEQIFESLLEIADQFPEWVWFSPYIQIQTLSGWLENCCLQRKTLILSTRYHMSISCICCLGVELCSPIAGAFRKKPQPLKSLQ